jgi:hypothetical protein
MFRSEQDEVRAGGAPEFHSSGIRDGNDRLRTGVHLDDLLPLSILAIRTWKRRNRIVVDAIADPVADDEPRVVRIGLYDRDARSAEHGYGDHASGE